MKSILFTMIAVTMILAVDMSGKSTMRGLNDWSFPLHRRVRAATADQHDLMTFELKPGGSQHMAFEMPMVEHVGSSAADYDEELVTGRCCVHLLWTSVGRVSVWTTKMTSERGCEEDDDIEVEEYEEQVEKELKRFEKVRKGRDVVTTERRLGRGASGGQDSAAPPTVVAASREHRKSDPQPLPLLRSVLAKTRHRVPTPVDDVQVAFENRSLKVGFDPIE